MASRQPATGRRASRCVELIRRRPLTAFFVLTYLFSWTAWTPYLLSEHGLGLLPFRFPTVLGSGQLFGAVPGAYLGPLGAAVLVIWLVEGRTGLRKWGVRLTHWRVGWRWCAFALIVFPGTQILAAMLLPGAVEGMRAPALATVLMLLPGLLIQILTTGIAEEPAWRGFALPRMQERFGPLSASVLLGLLWGAWHLPKFWTEWSPAGAAPLTILGFLGGTVLFSIVLTWAFNRTGASVPIVLLIHAGANNTTSILFHDVFPTLGPEAVSTAALVARAVLVIAIVLATGGWLSYVTSRAAAGHDDGRAPRR